MTNPMSMFDSIIMENREKYGLGDKAGNLVTSLLNLITDQSQGGFGGFLDRFKRADLGSVSDTWVGSGANTFLSGEQVESALGTETTGEMARLAGLDADVARAALGRIIPGVVDQLTPDGIVPTENDLLSRIGSYLSGVGSATVSTTGVMASETVDRFASASAEDIRRTDAGDLLDEDYNDNSPLNWLLPLILLIVLIAIGWAFCGNTGA
jgi:uncharacterized protein YidB (DUF937 family)